MPARRVEPGLAVRVDAPLLWAQQPGRDPQEARLARAGRPGESEALAALDGQLDVELERAEPVPGLNAEQRRAPRRRGPA